MPEAPMPIDFEPSTLICFIVASIIVIIILAKGRKD